jgi:hypothetical protein
VPRRPGGEAAVRARIHAAPGLNRSEGHRLAGLLDAECHLGLVPNNRDGWRCFCDVVLRDDDRDTLVEARTHLGLGRLSPVPARNGSRAQVRWMVSTKLECVALSELLDTHPLRGRKLAEYEIWREAVALWSAERYGLAPGVRARLARLAANLKVARAYQEPRANAPGPVLTDPDARHYFAGFFSGEGSFALSRRSARFVVKLRRDDRPLLDAFCRDFSLGTICNVDTPAPWSPAAVWHVTAARDVLAGIALFESAGLLGRKARQFLAWRPGAEAVARAIIAGEAVNERVVESARRALARATAYQAPGSSIPSDDPRSSARVAYTDVLRTWAASTDERLSCVTYEETRRRLRPDWPKRETIAAAFGGWYEALRCAGLADRAARRPSARQLGV